MTSLPFIDLKSQQARIAKKIDARINEVLTHGQYIMGPEVGLLEKELSAFCGAKHAISCSSGTDALMLGLIALGVKPGDGVIVPSFTFAATAEVLPCMGAVPIFADIDPVSFNLAPSGLDAAKRAAHAAGVEVVGIISVGLFGQPADMTAIKQYASEQKIWLIDDAAQSFGASWQGKSVGTLADITTTSFFPAKPLGCYGDGGAVFTDNDKYAETIISARIHGMSKKPYHYERIGMTARLDTIQAAVLLEKLPIFKDELRLRQEVADRYAKTLSSSIIAPSLHPDATSTWAQYCIRLGEGVVRQSLQDALSAKGIPTAIYYPLGMHEQTPYAKFPIAEDGLPHTKKASAEVLALPMHPYLDEETQSEITSTLNALLAPNA